MDTVHGDPELAAALARMADDPLVARLRLPDLVTRTLPAPWRLVTHRVQLFADVVVLRRGTSEVWGVLFVPTPVLGARPSAAEQPPPRPVPYADLDTERRREALAEALPAWVGTIPDIVAPWLPTQADYRNEELFEEQRSIPRAHLRLIQVLLDVAPAADRRALERMLAEVGVSVPVEVPERRGGR